MPLVLQPLSDTPSPSLPPPQVLPEQPVQPLDEYVAGGLDHRNPLRKVPLPKKAKADKEVAATDKSERQADHLRAQEIAAEMLAQRKLSQEKIQAIWANLQTEVLRIWQEVLLRRQKVMDDLLDKWCKVLFG